MKEQSHKQEMSAAIRGDFQRLRARGVSAALVPQESAEPSEAVEPTEPAEAVEQAEPAEQTGPAEPAERIDRAELSEPVELAGQPPADAEAESSPVERPSETGGWLSRLVRR